MFEYSHKEAIGGASVRARTDRHSARGHRVDMTGHDIDALVALGRSLHAAGYRFSIVTPATRRRVNRRAGNRHGHGLRDAFGWGRPFLEGALPAPIIRLMQDAGVLAHSGHALRAAVRAATLGGNLYFHTAGTGGGEDVFFGPDTVRFIGATMRAAQRLPAPARIVEIGCGAGPAAVELALRFPNAEVIASDVNPDALALTQANARLAGARLATCRSDVLADVEGGFDLAVSNPPYILDSDQRTYRDGGGMLGAELSLRIAREALERLRPGGTLLLYTGVALTGPDDHFLAALRPSLERHCAHWDYEELDPDVFGEQLSQPGYEEVERIAAVFLTARKRMG